MYVHLPYSWAFAQSCSYRSTFTRVVVTTAGSKGRSHDVGVVPYNGFMFMAATLLIARALQPEPPIGPSAQPRHPARRFRARKMCFLCKRGTKGDSRRAVSRPPFIPSERILSLVRPKRPSRMDHGNWVELTGLERKYSRQVFDIILGSESGTGSPAAP